MLKTGSHEMSSALTRLKTSDTMCHMKTITIRQLHDKTGEWVRKAARLGEIYVSERGRTIAKILPQMPAVEIPYFARRKLSRRFRAVMEKFEGGTDSTRIISEERDRPLR